MKWHPLWNALGATAYITCVVTLLHTLEKYRHDTPDTIVDGAAALSLFVFSAAVMAFLFFYRPLVLLIDGRKEEALCYFLKTLISFGVITVVVFIVLSLQ